jgi:hypothetical protein
MKVKAGQLWTSQQALSELLSKPLPGLSAYQVGRIVKLAQIELATLQEQMKALIAKHEGIVRENGSVTFMDNTKGQSMMQEWDEVLSVELELNAQPVSASKLGAVEVTPALMLTLDWMITE